MLSHSPAELALMVSNRRKQLKLSQAALADLVGLKQATISAFENKPESTKLETLFAILAAANLDLNITPKENGHANKTTWQEEW